MKSIQVSKAQLSRISPITITLVVLFAAVMTYILTASFAATGSASLNARPTTSQTVQNGSTFSVNVVINSDVATGGAEVTINYPADKLQLISVGGDSPYNFPFENQSNPGSLRLVKARFDAGTGSNSVAPGDALYTTLTFKALATGSAPISFSTDSTVRPTEDPSANILTARNGATYSIVSPAAATAPTSNTTPASGGAPQAASGSKAQTSRSATSSGGSSVSGGAAPASGSSGGGATSSAPADTTVAVAPTDGSAPVAAPDELASASSKAPELGDGLNIPLIIGVAVALLVLTPLTVFGITRFKGSSLAFLGGGSKLHHTNSDTFAATPTTPAAGSAPVVTGVVDPKEFHHVSDAISVPVKPPGEVVTPTVTPSQPK